MMPDAARLWKSKHAAACRRCDNHDNLARPFGAAIENEVERIVDPAGKNQDGEPLAEESVIEQEAEAPAEQLLELILEAHQARAVQEPLPKTVDGVVIARIASVDDAGVVRVTYPGTPNDGVLARVMTRVTTDDVGRDAALLFEGGDREKPILMGLLFRGQTSSAPATVVTSEQQVTMDDQRVVLSAEREIVLQCGDASITLTRAGKILIKGTYVLSRSSGTNRIQGGSVQIN